MESQRAAHEGILKNECALAQSERSLLFRFLGSSMIPLNPRLLTRLCCCDLSLVMRKPDFRICENKDADQLRGTCNREADQRLQVVFAT